MNFTSVDNALAFTENAINICHCPFPWFDLIRRLSRRDRPQPVWSLSPHPILEHGDDLHAAIAHDANARRVALVLLAIEVSKLDDALAALRPGVQGADIFVQARTHVIG